jgi:hypothetical protein
MIIHVSISVFFPYLPCKTEVLEPLQETVLGPLYALYHIIPSLIFFAHSIIPRNEKNGESCVEVSIKDLRKQTCKEGIRIPW